MKKADDIKPTLKISYKDFVAVLRKWESYVWPELKKMPKGMAAVSSEQAMYARDDDDVEVASSIRLSDLAAVLWKSLEAGAKEVDRIHDEEYAKDQVKFFVGLYSSPNALVRRDHVYSMLLSTRPKLDPPSEIFLELGKPAQAIIVRDGLLTKATKVYELARSIIAGEVHAIREEEEERRREARERRAAPDYVRGISTATRTQVRELDKGRCVFCDADVSDRFHKQSFIRLTPKGYKVNDVVLACKDCKAKLEGKTPEEAGMATKFGRFNSASQV